MHHNPGYTEDGQFCHFSKCLGLWGKKKDDKVCFQRLLSEIPGMAYCSRWRKFEGRHQLDQKQRYNKKLVFVLLACSTRTAFQPSRAQLTRQLVTRHLIVKWINYHLRYYSIHKFSNSSSKHLLCLTQSKSQQNVSESRAEYVKFLWVVHGLVEGVGNPDLFKLLDGVTGEASTLNKLKLIGES